MHRKGVSSGVTSEVAQLKHLTICSPPLCQKGASQI